MNDFFISYNHKDLDIAQKIYVWLLEEGYSCIMQHINFKVGNNFVLAMDGAIKECERTIAVLSPDYLNSKYTQPEWAAAFAKDPKGEKSSLFVIKVRDCELQGLLSQIIYTDVVGLSENEIKYRIIKAVRALIKKVKNSKFFDSPKLKNKSLKKDYNKITQTIKGDKNIQVARDYIVTKNAPQKIILPPPDSIGSDSLLKQNIKMLFNKIGEAREKRFGKNAYVVMYKNFKSDFGIKNNKWTIIWTWPKQCALSIQYYLKEKYNKTISGRMEKAAKKSNYLHTRPYLYKNEKELLEHLGLDMKSTEVKKLLHDYFNVTSHRNLTHLDHWQFVCYLEGKVKELEDC